MFAGVGRLMPVHNLPNCYHGNADSHEDCGQPYGGQHQHENNNALTPAGNGHGNLKANVSAGIDPAG
jgi:hypothetical protein